MRNSNQYLLDVEKVSALVSQYTGIPSKKLSGFIKEYGASKLLDYSGVLCETPDQLNSLNSLFDFKGVYDALKSAEHNKKYVLNSSEKAIYYFDTFFKSMPNDRERVAVAFVDSSFKVLSSKVISEGSSSASLIPVGNIVKDALLFNAKGVFLAHNHLSSLVRPSNSDVLITERFMNALNLHDIALHDHIIIGSESYCSLDDRGLMPLPKPEYSMLISDFYLSKPGSKNFSSDIYEQKIAHDRVSQNPSSPVSNISKNRKLPDRV